MAIKTLRQDTSAGFVTKGSSLTNSEMDQTLISLDEDILTKVSRNGDTLTGKLTFNASSSNIASLNIPNGADPSEPIAGDVWGSLSGLKYRFGSNTRTVSFTDNPVFSGKILGDFTNAQQTQRLLFQTTALNNSTSVGAVPSGTGQNSSFQVYNSQDASNASVGQISISSTVFTISSGITGTGTPLPISFITNGNERLRIDNDGSTVFQSLATFTGIISNTLSVNGGVISTTATTASIFGSNVTTLNIGSAASSVSLGINTGTLSVPGTISTSAITGNIFNTGVTTLNIGSAASTINIGASGAAFRIGGSNVLSESNHNSTGDPHTQYLKKSADSLGQAQTRFSLQASVDATGLELGIQGNTAAGGSTFIDFHTGPTAIDFDSRIIASGGTGTSGGGVLQYEAMSHTFVGSVNVQGNFQVNGAPINIYGVNDVATVITTNTTLINKGNYEVNTSSSPLTVTLPASPAAGTIIRIADYLGTFQINSLTVARNGSNIMGLAEDMIINSKYAAIVLLYVNSIKGWSIF